MTLRITLICCSFLVRGLEFYQDQVKKLDLLCLLYHVASGALYIELTL